jgi:hypothetical protein
MFNAFSVSPNDLGIAEGGANYLPTLSLNLSLPTFGNTLLGDFYFLLFATQKIIKSCRFIEIILFWHLFLGDVPMNQLRFY